MNFQDMIDETKILVQDSSYDDLIPSYINDSLIQAAIETQLPDLKRVALVTTAVDAPYISIPDLGIDFAGRVLGVRPKYETFRDLETMVETLDITDINELGDEIKGICLEGGNLWYWPTPNEVQSITLFFMTNPPLLYYPEDEIKYFPDHIQRLALCHGAASLCYEKIEDGLEGDKVNTTYHKGQQELGIQRLREYKGKNRNHYISSVWRV
jgi:hypothetical protein